ncbi:MAG: ATP synthase subunit a [Candidatus Falkowbacteria bacterium GW2011_GWC2_38_22]|uniref:ATP synthase subunit a n=1 Tax=Candidatus Falkowbacteria bacterium GW2011_GWE1_38_31 TaxID=1618638 RepID=A0A0G0MAI8_9BACT|nr:MAG: ATP synthase subunit a [Candidatus Falkowbacteria bacterium GW2011_GWF2_38_1205]KKQ61934.1 MAG: ATP synthase subunit a [Candidatus Falkowbacteria bacterium GW2011_GWC2_38_22]KKQ63904.1 MAG: ATP synthase subunit a [Candidatus Falkowbacteria bacterium GW2011_GWF1_38_22]KKQ66161.1 MAG: ATP synthase subunit a [Candidatus Falkowbacteria bacterium GW2011_GWE2_38_254]KKQ70764.1 MAG: ATP synthase subunit a [Candidatus Falkowbacteria bacterium GW2011_GWE1_38_31]KKQ73134.1 MAG: ATP synthase subu
MSEHAENSNQGSVSHEHTLYAEPIFHVGAFTVTNSILNSWIVVFLILVLSLFIRRKVRIVPKGIQNVFEMVIEKFLGIFDLVTQSRSRSLKFFPLVFSFFIFILFSNWMGILPGVGSIGQIAYAHGEKVFVPYFRGGTADLNTTLALAIIGVVASHIFGIIALGAWRYFNKFINIRAFLEIPKKIRKDPMIIFVNPIKAFVGLIEIIGEIAKVASLSFRLFGNVFAGEVLLASMSAILAFGVPLPFIFLEVIVGMIQALIFSVLILAYLTMNTSAEEH